MRHRALPWLWLVGMVACLAFSLQRLRQGPVIDTSLLTLLPAAEEDALLREANTLLSERGSRMMVFLATHSDPDTALEMNQQLKEDLTRSAYVRRVLSDVTPEQQKAFYDLYFPLRYQMLSASDRLHLASAKPLPFFMARLNAALYSPASSFLKNLIPEDPLLLFPELARSWAQTAPAEAREGPVFSAVQLAQDPFDSKSQEAMMGWVTDLRRTYQARWPQGEIHTSGVLPFAAAERQRTEREMTWVSLVAFMGVLLLTWTVFKSLHALLLAALPITAGFLVASAVTMAVFGKIHMITLAFGSSLIGVAIDYPLLYLAHYRMAGSSWDAWAAMRRVSSGLVLGALCTLLGYGALSLAPFPGLRQMALFSSVGLLSALTTVLVLFPHFLKPPYTHSEEPLLLRLGRRFLALLERLRTSSFSRPVLVITTILLLGIIGGGLGRVHFDDDIRRLQQPPKALLEEEALMQEATHGVGGQRFILIRGANLEELLTRQEALYERLRALFEKKTITSIQSLAPFIPSRAQQESDRRLLLTGLAPHRQALLENFKALGLAPQVGAALFKALPAPLSPFSIDTWLASPAAQSLQSLWIGSTAQGFAAATLVGGLTDAAALRDTVKDLPGVRFFDQIEAYSSLFKRYRHFSMGLILGAYAVVWLLLIFRYGMKKGTLMPLPAATAIVLTFALLGWRGTPLHLIHVLSALLVLSMGVDYTIYFMESARSASPNGPTLLAVELCALTTLLSFGLLALCHTPVLAAIGSVVFWGMALSFVLSPLPSLFLDKSC